MSSSNSVNTIVLQMLPSVRLQQQQQQQTQSSPKKIIRLTRSQLFGMPMAYIRQPFSNSSMINNISPPAATKATIAPLGLGKTCGLFDFDSADEKPNFDVENENLSIENFPFDQQAAPSAEFSDLVGAENQQLMETTNSLDLNSLSGNAAQSPVSNQSNAQPAKSKFAKKLSELNMKITIPSAPSHSISCIDTPMISNILIDDEELNTVMTPGTEKKWLQFIHSIPSNQIQSAHILSNGHLIESLGCDEESLERLLLNSAQLVVAENVTVDQNGEEDPFLNSASELKLVAEAQRLEQQLSAGSEGVRVVPKARVDSVSMEHDYSNKRKISTCSFDESSCQSSDTFSSSFAESSAGLNLSSSESARKKQRTRGIYRLDDVTNEEELQNYLERRKKNNISSKASRANKKKVFTDMDGKCDFLNRENNRLQTKIDKLEQINKTMKDLLIEKFTGAPK